MNTNTENAPAMSPEQAADLAALQASADSQAPEGVAAQVESVVPDLAGEIKALVLAFVAMAGPILPSLKRIYTEETAEQAAGAVAAVCEKHGWASGGLMGEWGVEIGAAVVLLPMAFATVQGVKADIVQNKLNEQHLIERKRADLQQHNNIAHNADGKTEQVAPVESASFGEVQPSANG